MNPSLIRPCVIGLLTAVATAAAGCGGGGGDGQPRPSVGPPDNQEMIALAGVPANHGIAPANEITVQSGSSERLGNVDVSCPAGGPACVFSVAGDGTVAYRATGGMPTVVAATAVLTAVPANHGIAPANEITIQPGSTVRLGNVDVSCPAGGPSCVFGVARDGMIAYRVTGGTPTIAAATAVLTDIPTNHGIASADDITVQPGSTERLGNVDVSCPAGGSACFLSVAVDGTVAYRATGGMPNVVAATSVLVAVPANHGISPANEITIEPGSTERLGNVDVSCPAGGSACFLSVAVDGTVAYRATGGTPTVMVVTVVLTDFPADHGIAPTDEIAIQPGSTERLGNVDVSCPAGGPTCFVSVAGDGTVAYRRTGGMPTAVSMSAKWPFSPVAGSTPDAATILSLIYGYAGGSSSSTNVFCCHGWERVTVPSPPSEDMLDIQLYDWSYWTDPDMSPEPLAKL